MKEREDAVTVAFFEGRQGKLWLALLILSPLLALLFAVFAFLYADDGAIVIIGCCAFCAVCLLIFGVCIATARLRTSRWTADEEGIGYFAFGRRVLHFRWEEIREAGFLVLEGEKRTSQLRLYWSTAELRGKLRSGKFPGREKGLGANRRGATMMVYCVPALYGDNGAVRYPEDDAIILFTRAHLKRPLRHENFLTGTDR